MMKRILITGAGGMVGSHMLDALFEQNVDVVGTYYKPTTDLDEVREKAKLIECDVRYFSSVFDVLEVYQPNTIYHLAAQSYPTVSWDRPQETMEVNATGTINVFESIRKIKARNPEYDPVVVVACSSAEYGNTFNFRDEPVDEYAELLPLHPYGVSKIAQDMLAYQYYENFGIRTIRARIFNTTGPRKANDVCSDITRRIVTMEKSGILSGVLQVGNMETRRAITDVRDLVRALIALAEKGKAGDVYNISGEKIYQIREIVETIRKLTPLSFSVDVAPPN